MLAAVGMGPDVVAPAPVDGALLVLLALELPVAVAAALKDEQAALPTLWAWTRSLGWQLESRQGATNEPSATLPLPHWQPTSSIPQPAAGMAELRQAVCEWSLH